MAPPRIVSDTPDAMGHLRSYNNGVTIGGNADGSVSIGGRNTNPPEVLRTLIQDFNQRCQALDAQTTGGRPINIEHRGEFAELQQLEQRIHQYTGEHPITLSNTLKNAAKNINTNPQFCALQRRFSNYQTGPNPTQQLQGLQQSRNLATLGPIQSTATSPTANTPVENRVATQVITANPLRPNPEALANAEAQDRRGHSNLWTASRTALSLARQNLHNNPSEALRNLEVTQGLFRQMEEQPNINPQWYASTLRGIQDLRVELSTTQPNRELESFCPRSLPHSVADSRETLTGLIDSERRVLNGYTGQLTVEQRAVFSNVQSHLNSLRSLPGADINYINEVAAWQRSTGTRINPETATTPNRAVAERDTTAEPATPRESIQIRRGNGNAAGARSEQAVQTYATNVDLPQPSPSINPVAPATATAPASPLPSVAEAQRLAAEAERSANAAIRGLGAGVSIPTGPAPTIVLNPNDFQGLAARPNTDSPTRRETTNAAPIITATTPAPSAAARTLPRTAELTAADRAALRDLEREGPSGGPVGTVTTAATTETPTPTQAFSGRPFTASGPNTATTQTLGSQIHETLNRPLGALTQFQRGLHRIDLTIRYNDANHAEYQLNVTPPNPAIEGTIIRALPRLPQFDGPLASPVSQSITINYGS